MPVIAVNLAPAVFTEISSLVEKGFYASPAQFLEIAAFNQVALERGTKPTDTTEEGHHERPRAPSPPSAGVRDKSKKLGRPARARATPLQTKTAATSTSRVSAEDLKGTLERLSLRTHEVPTPITATPRPSGERVYGLVNRLFPLKLSCRWIHMANADGRRWKKHDALREGLAADAAIIGTALENLDAAAQRKRDELLATGLPRKGHVASAERFLSQYLARTTRAGEIYPGALCQFALAHFDGERLALTDRGLELARLRNRLLDGEFATAASNLDVTECDFLIEQVRLFVPGELHDWKLLLASIDVGSATPDALLEAMKLKLPPEWTETMVRSHVSGGLARLAELGAIKRKWEGRNVTYETVERIQQRLQAPEASP